MFIHAGIYHFAFNILVQLVLGIPLEMVHGEKLALITGFGKSPIPWLRELVSVAIGGITQPRNRTFAEPCLWSFDYILNERFCHGFQFRYPVCPRQYWNIWNLQFHPSLHDFVQLFIIKRLSNGEFQSVCQVGGGSCWCTYLASSPAASLRAYSGRPYTSRARAAESTH